MAGTRGPGAGEQFADVIGQAGVRGQVGARRAPDRFLVDEHQTPDAFHALQNVATKGDHGALEIFPLIFSSRNVMAKLFRDEFHQNLTDQARFA